MSNPTATTSASTSPHIKSSHSSSNGGSLNEKRQESTNSHDKKLLYTSSSTALSSHMQHNNSNNNNNNNNNFRNNDRLRASASTATEDVEVDARDGAEEPPEEEEDYESILQYISEEEIAVVRQALTAIGYPDPSTQDIVNVFRVLHQKEAEQQQQQREAEDDYYYYGQGADGEKRSNNNRVGLSLYPPPPPPAAPAPAPAGGVTPSAAYNFHAARVHQNNAINRALLSPQARLARYVRHYERNLQHVQQQQQWQRDTQDVHHRGVTTSTPQQQQQRQQQRPHTPSQPQQQHAHRRSHPAMHSSTINNTTATHNHNHTNNAKDMTISSFYDNYPQHAPGEALQPVSRETANLIYSITGDRRYRYQDDGAAAAVAEEGGAWPAQLAGRRPLRLYNPQRTAAPISHAAPFTTSPAAADPKETNKKLISLYAVDYLAADGSSLHGRRTDPVLRGEHVRALWSRDPFLVRMERGKKK